MTEKNRLKETLEKNNFGSDVELIMGELKMIEKSRERKLKETLEKYDFGFDVALINSESWQKKDDEYTSKIYLELIDTSNSSPQEGIIQVNFEKDTDTLISVGHQMPSKLVARKSFN